MYLGHHSVACIHQWTFHQCNGMRHLCLNIFDFNSILINFPFMQISNYVCHQIMKIRQIYNHNSLIYLLLILLQVVYFV